jgi:predicted RNA-binding Zn ribbon-like protein
MTRDNLDIMPYVEPEPVRLMNTIWADTDGIHDDLTTSEPRARLLRDALRRLAAAVTDDTRHGAESAVADRDEAMAVINEFAAVAPRDQLALRDGRLTLTHEIAADSARARLAELATAAIRLFTGPDAETLHACLAPGCVRYFTKSHPRREWCSEGCGNRVRAARHYERIRKSRPGS